MGPLAGAVFAQYLVELAPAATDQEHIPVVLINDPNIPDRTAYILGASTRSPLPHLIDHARKLEQLGAELIAIPCNTAHVFWSEVARSVSIPVLNIIDETARRIESEEGSRRIGLLATKGTVKAGLYQKWSGGRRVRTGPSLRRVTASSTGDYRGSQSKPGSRRS